MAVNKSLSILLLLTGIFGFYSKSIAQESSPRSLLIENNLVSGEPFESERFPVDRMVELSIFTLNGNVEVYENSDIDYIQIDLYVDRGFSFWSGGTSLDNYRIIFQKTRTKIIASVEPRRNESKVWKGDNISFSYVVQTPVELHSRIRNTKGDIYVRGIRGSQQIQATVGNLYLEDLEGEINAYSASGKIEAAGMRGLFNAKTTNGDIDVQESQGEMRLRSVTGSINALQVHGTFIAATTTGSVHANLRSAGEGSYIETVTGAVDLTLPAQMNYNIEVNGSSVDISRLISNQEFEGRVTGKSANVTMGEGKIPVQVSSVTGNITVKRGAGR